MDDTSGSSIVTKIVIAIFVVVLFDLGFVNWWILKKANSAQVYTAPTEKIIEKTVVPTNVGTPETGKATSADSSNKSLSDNSKEGDSAKTASGQVATDNVVVQTPNKEIFVPLGSGQTRESTFVDLYGAEVNIDSAKYAPIDAVYLEASIWIEDGNGKVWAQLKNVTDNNPLIESQISNPTSTPTLRGSGKIPLASGSKTYRVQAKTELEGYVAHVDNARLKIVLK